MERYLQGSVLCWPVVLFCNAAVFRREHSPFCPKGPRCSLCSDLVSDGVWTVAGGALQPEIESLRQDGPGAPVQKPKVLILLVLGEGLLFWLFQRESVQVLRSGIETVLVLIFDSSRIADPVGLSGSPRYKLHYSAPCIIPRIHRKPAVL